MTRGKQPMAPGPSNFYQGLLAREIVRQGLLLAAREELGAITRDVPIGDPTIAVKPDATFRVGSRFRTSSLATPEDPAVRYLKQADTEHCHLWFRFLVRNARRARGVELDPIPW